MDALLSRRLPNPLRLSQFPEQTFRGRGDFCYCRIERHLIRFRRLSKTAHLPHKLQRGRRYFLGCHRILGPSQYFDASTHNSKYNQTISDMPENFQPPRLLLLPMCNAGIELGWSIHS